MPTDDKVVPFPKRKPAFMEGFDEAGISTVILHVVYGVRCIYRGKIAGTQLFTTKEKQQHACNTLNAECKKADQQHQYKFNTVDYPVY